MRIAIPKETYPGENRVPMIPDVAKKMVRMGAEVVIESGMGEGSGFPDSEYTDVGCEVSATGIQVHGGMGFIEETGAAQFFRDVRVTAIYEGTNGIQAMDLVARKMMDGGEAMYRLLDEIEAGAEVARGTFPELTEKVWAAAETLRETT